MFKLFLNVVIVFLIFFVEVAYVNRIKRIYDDDDDIHNVTTHQQQCLQRGL